MKGLAAGAAAWAAAWAAVFGTGAAAACELPPDAAAGGGQRRVDGLQLAWRPAGGSPPGVAQPLTLEIALCPASARLRRADAVMPEHRHGMNYRPTRVETAPGRWRSEGWLFHMPGRWELRFDVERGDRVERVTLPLDLR